MLEKNTLMSIVLYGPNGCGKTALSKIILKKSGLSGYRINAAACGVDEVKSITSKAIKFNEKIILVVDEIYHFSRTQQDVLLPAIDNGNVILIGITTQNPFFYVLSGLLSRCIVFEMKPPDDKSMGMILEKCLKKLNLEMDVEEKSRLIKFSNGDVRKLIGMVNFVYANKGKNVEELLKNKFYQVFVKEEAKYDMISAFIKSVRGSDPNASVYWLARMLLGGVDPRYIARRLVILASEDIGLAEPSAFNLAVDTYLAVERVGMPESEIILSFAAIYLALAPKSNSAYIAIKNATEAIKNGLIEQVPKHLKDANLDSVLGDGAGYKYPHDYGGFVRQSYMEKPVIFFRPVFSGKEKEFALRVYELWKELYEEVFNKETRKEKKEEI